MSFKVTLRKNGRPVGEMCYPSEAVAVTQAAAMTKAAPGTTASVSTGTKSNPRRNPSPSGWTVAQLWWSGPRRDTPVVYSKAGHPNVEQNTQGTWYIAGHKVSTVYSSAVAAMTVAETMKGDAYGQMKSNPRRNGQVFWTPQGPAVEAHSPTQWTSVEIESRDGGKTYSVVAYGYADGHEIRSVRVFGIKTVGAAQKRADDVRRELRVRSNPRRNGGSAHICRNPGCGCRANPRRNAGGGIGFRWEKGDTSNEWTLLLDGEPVADLVRAYSEKWGGAGKGRVADASKPMFWTLVPWRGSSPSMSPCRSGATVAEAKAAAESIMRGRLKSNPRHNGETEGRRMASFSLARRLDRNGA